MKFIKIFVSYMIKYLLGFLLIFVTNIVMFYVARSSVESYIIKQVETQIEDGIQTVENTVEKMDLIEQMLYQSNDFTKLVYTGKNFPKKDITLVKNSNDLLKQIGYITNYTPYMFCVFKDNDLFLSNSQCSITFPDYYGSFLSVRFSGEEDMDASGFKDYLFDRKKQGYRFLKADLIKYTYDGKELNLNDAVLYLADGSASYTSEAYVFCFVLSKESLVEEIWSDGQEKDCFLLIRDGISQKELASYGEVPESVMDEAYAAETEKGYHMMECLDNSLGWRITAGISVSYISRQMTAVQRLLMIYLGLGFAAVIVLTLYFSLGRYYSFRKMVSAFPAEEIEPDRKAGFNQYKYVSDYVTRLDDKRQAYRQQLEELKRQNRAIILESIMTRGISSEQERQVFAEYFGQEPEFYCVAMVSILQMQGEIAENAAVDMVNFLSRKKIAVLGNVHSGIADELFLIERFSFQEGNVSDLVPVFEEMAEAVSTQYGCVLHMAISAVGTGIYNISKCYEQAKCIVQAQYMCENETIVQAYDITASSLYENAVTIEFMNRLYTMLISGQYSNAEKELNQIEGRYSRAAYLYEANKEQIFYSIRNVFHTAILHLNVREGEGRLPLYENTLKCHDMTAAFRQSAAWICNYIGQRKKSKNEVLYQNIREYMETHYNDPGMSAYSVSQHVGIAEKYLYQFWKEQTGETFAAWLLRLRIDRAKQYLEQTDYSNEQIALLTGFASLNTFYRNFQKLAGVTPKKYKENRLKNKEE